MDVCGRNTLQFEFRSLVPMRSEHAQLVVGWRNNPENAAWFVEKRQFSVEQHSVWLARADASGIDFNWVIVDPKGYPVGTIGLYNIDSTAGQAEVGRILIGDREARGRGYARSALREVIRLAEYLGLGRIYLEVFVDNISAINLYRSLSFADGRVQGRLQRFERKI